MAHRIHNIKPITVDKKGMVLVLGTERLNRNLNNAQFKLDSVIMTSMKPYMPMQDGNFIKRVDAKNGALAGSGEVYAAVGPEGRYLYEGKKMVDSATGKGPMKITDEMGEESIRWRKGATLKPTDQPLEYTKSKKPMAQSHWFEKAKEADGDKWKKVVDDEMSKP